MNEECRTAVSDTPATRLRNAVESAGFTIEGLPDDLTVEQFSRLAQDLSRQLTHIHAPEVAALLDAGDTHGAAGAFMRMLDDTSLAGRAALS